MSLFDRVQQTLATTLKVPPSRISASTVDEDLPSWDSLGQVNIVMALEQTFDLMIEVEDFEERLPGVFGSLSCEMKEP